MQVQMYPQAAHCYEELLMHMPHSIPLYVQYADIMYTMGGSNFRTARRALKFLTVLTASEIMYRGCSKIPACGVQR